MFFFCTSVIEKYENQQPQNIENICGEKRSKMCKTTFPCITCDWLQVYPAVFRRSGAGLVPLCV